MNTLIENAPQIIAEAAKSSLGLAALVVLATSCLAYIFFRNASQTIKITIFIPVLFGFILFVIALANVDKNDLGSPPRVYSQAASRAAEEAVTNMLNGSADGLSVPFCDTRSIYNDKTSLRQQLGRSFGRWHGSGPVDTNAVGVQSVTDYMDRANNLIERGGYNKFAATHPCGQQNIFSVRDYAVEIYSRFLNIRNSRSG